MPTWKHHLKVGDVFNDDDLEVNEKAKIIASRIRSLPWGSDPGFDIMDLLEEFEEVDTEDYFDTVWDAIYDWADRERVWIETWQTC